MSPEQSMHDWEPYFQAYLKDIHQILMWGYEGARTKIMPDDDEPVITGYIVAAMVDKLQEPSTSDYYDRYEPHENMPVNTDGRTGKNRSLPDIVIRCKGIRPWLEFFIEAKRLKSNGFPIGEYIGKDGLQCYLRGDYAVDNEIAAMVAYIQSDTPLRWFDQLNHRFVSDKDGMLAIKSSLTHISVIPELHHEWISEHNRYCNRTIKLLHIFFQCCQSIEGSDGN